MVLAVAGVAEAFAADSSDGGHVWRPVSTALPKSLYERQGIVALVLPNEVPDLCQKAIRQVIQA